MLSFLLYPYFVYSEKIPLFSLFYNCRCQFLCGSFSRPVGTEVSRTLVYANVNQSHALCVDIGYKELPVEEKERDEEEEEEYCFIVWTLYNTCILYVKLFSVFFTVVWKKVFVCGFVVLCLCCFCFVLSAFICMLCIFMTYSTSCCCHYKHKDTWNVRVCIQNFPDWPPGARTANGTALCHYVQLYGYFVSQSSEFFRHNPLCCFSASVYCCLIRYDSCVCVCACMYVCMHACMHVCMYACVYVCMYVCMHARMYACMCVCMHACTHA
jgi:hypothetical protein